MAITTARPIIRRVFDGDPDNSDLQLHVRLDLANVESPLQTFQTKLSEIPGLMPKDLEPYGDGTGYVLVASVPIEDRDKEMVDLIFRVLPGNERIIKEKGAPNLIPSKFLKRILRTITKTDVADPAEPSTLSGNLRYSRTEEQEGTGLSERTNVEEELVAGAALGGRMAYTERGKAAVSEDLVADGTEEASGRQIVESRVDPLGNGLSQIRTVTADAFKEHISSRRDTRIGGHQVILEKFTDPPTDVAAAIADPNIEYHIVNDDRALRRTYQTPTAALTAYVMAFASTASVPLPNVLRELGIVWNSSDSEGDFTSDATGAGGGTAGSINIREGGSAQSAASLQPELSHRIDRYQSSDVPVLNYVFYLPYANDTAITNLVIRAKLAGIIGGPVLQWPLFRPVIHTFALRGGKVSVSARAQGGLALRWSNSGWAWSRSKGSGTSKSVGSSTGFRQLPPVIHGIINLTDTARALGIVARAEAYYSIPAVTQDPDGNPTVIQVPVINVNEAEPASVDGSVSPSSLAATSPTEVPTSGYYLRKTRVEASGQYSGWAMVWAQVIDASELNLDS